MVVGDCRLGLIENNIGNTEDVCNVQYLRKLIFETFSNEHGKGANQTIKTLDSLEWTLNQ
jgi:hypothetical protein